VQRRRAPRLLLADDDPVVVATLTAQLRNAFEIVAGAASAVEAIELAEWRSPEVALIDVEMPHGGGLRATREIRERSPNVAIVALSADESEAGVREMLDAGAVAYLRKGASKTDIIAALDAALTAHSALASPSSS
jgi:DNA-binding NarL/FixJ family response regulator